MKTQKSPHIFSPSDLRYIQDSGRLLENAYTQLERFKKGFPSQKLVRPASPKDGILTFQSKEEQDSYIDLYELESQKIRACKFVPASGAASRMFRSLYEYLNTPDQLHENILQEVDIFFKNLPRFAFFDELKTALVRDGNDFEKSLKTKDYASILTYLLTEKGLHYGMLPKALLPFHRYETITRTALEEHLMEGIQYGLSKGNMVRMHITLSVQHKPLFEKYLGEIAPEYEQRFGCQFGIDISIQHPNTDTLAVDMKNEPFRDEKGDLLFRPGGHGALLRNLNEIDADIVFIKNVDNVVADKWRASTIYWKKLIGGVLIDHQRKIFEWLHLLDTCDESTYDTHECQLLPFMKEVLCIGFDYNFPNWEAKKRMEYAHRFLNRPLRVCGIIRTEANTGGGPFWVENETREQSLQILETAEINIRDSAQNAILNKLQFANITDLVCGLKDYKGQPFDLFKFRNEQAGFISHKSLNGRSLKAMEHPGLWNGCMAKWNTLLVEVPSETFNPVKSVMDLLGIQHQQYHPTTPNSVS